MPADVILPAAGTGERMNLPVAKQFLTVLGKHILAYTVDSFHRLPWIRYIVVVVSADAIEFTKQLLRSYGFTRTLVCAGSQTRHRSIFCGIKALQSECSGNDVVIIHDAARPFVPEQVTKEVMETAFFHGAAGVTRPLVSTVIRADDDARLVESLDRRLYTNSEMPQAFHYSVIAAAYEKCSEDDLDFGTECLLLAMKYSQCRAVLVKGTDDLWKVTYQKDVYSMESIVKEKFMVVSIIHNDFELLALIEFRYRLLQQQVKVADSTDAPANTFVLLWSLQTCCDLQTLNDAVTKICSSYNLDMPSSAVKLDLMVVIVFLQMPHSPSSQSDYQNKIVDTNFRNSMRRSQLWLQNVEFPSAGTSNLNDSFKFDSKTGSAQDVQEQCDHKPKVSFTDPVLSPETRIPSNENILDPTPKSQTNSTELSDTLVQEVDAENSLMPSSFSVRLSSLDSYELRVKRDVVSRSFISCQTVVQTVKENVQSEIGGKFALVVGVSCRPESAISEQLVQLVWQRSLYMDGQILIF